MNGTDKDLCFHRAYMARPLSPDGAETQSAPDYLVIITPWFSPTLNLFLKCIPHLHYCTVILSETSQETPDPSPINHPWLTILCPEYLLKSSIRLWFHCAALFSSFLIWLPTGVSASSLILLAVFQTAARMIIKCKSEPVAFCLILPSGPDRWKSEFLTLSSHPWLSGDDKAAKTWIEIPAY